METKFNNVKLDKKDLINLIIKLDILDVKTHKKLKLPLSLGIEENLKERCLALGIGGLDVYGGNRLIFSFTSKLTNNFHFSAMGGAGIWLRYLGIRNIVLKNKARRTSLLIIEKENDILKLSFLDMEDFARKYKSLEKLKEFVINKFGNKEHRAILIGPAAMSTSYGAICSHNVTGGKYIKGSIDWAGRGGVGSSLYKDHNLLGIVFITDKKPKINEKFKEISSFIEEKENKRIIELIISKTKKYKYDNEKRTGGTFGSNYTNLMGKLPFFNWNNFKFTEKEKEDIYKIINEKILDVFNREAIEGMKFANCGDICPIMCKKYRKGVKVDYEPYNSNGPLLGIFDLYEIDEIVKRVDDLGYDAIEFGNRCGFLLETLSKGVLDYKEFELSKKPEFKIGESDKEIVLEILEKITFSNNENFKALRDEFLRGINYLSKKYNTDLRKYGIYIKYNEEGSITPTEYIALGNFFPFLIQGKFLTYYKPGVFKEPGELGKLSAEAFKNELMLESTGICRFHRGWLSPYLNEICKRFYGFDLIEENKVFIKKMVKFNYKNGYTYDKNKIIEIFMDFVLEYGTDEWKEKVMKDKEASFDEFFNKTMESYFKNLT